MIHNKCQKCGKKFDTERYLKIVLCPECKRERKREMERKWYVENIKSLNAEKAEADRKKKKPKSKSEKKMSLEDIERLRHRYIDEHGYISYGKFCALIGA